MAHYALVTRPDQPGETWRACAILMAGGPQAAARQARALRLGGGLAFVPSPSRFRIRRASRGEVAMLVGFFQGMGAPLDAMASQADMDAGFARRERLLRSFFLALYLNPESLRRKYGIPSKPSAPPGSGGTVSESDMGFAPSGVVSQTDAQSIETEATNPSPVLEVPVAVDEGDSPLGSDNQENALAAILASAEANDGGHGREQSFDLDIL